MEGNFRRPSPWKPIVLIAVSLLVVALAAVVGVRSAANRQWARLEQRTEDLYRQWEARPGRRLPLWGPPIPGNAWDDYLAAFQAMKKFPQTDRQMLVSFLLRSPDADTTTIRSLTERHAEALGLLSKGAHREEARYRHPANRLAMRLPPEGVQWPLGDLSLLAHCKARLLLSEGRNREAMELLLDQGMAGLDVAQRSFGIDQQDGANTINAAFRELRFMVAAGRLDPAALKDLDRRLADLESLWPVHAWELGSELLDLGWLFQREDESDESHLHINGVPHPRRGWRTFYSTRLQAATSFFRADAWIQKAAAAEALPWAQAWPILEGLYQESETDPDVVLRDFGVLTRIVWIRQSQAAARLLRMGCRFRETGEVLEVEDPFGGKLKATVREGRLRAWSRGPTAVGPDPQEPAATHPEDLQIDVGR